VYVNLFGISKYYRDLIKTGEIKPLYLLETADKEKYDIIIEILPKNYNAKNYYYSISYNIMKISDLLDNSDVQDFSLEGYEKIKKLSKNHEMEFITYDIYYREYLSNKYSGYTGDPTGKCFTAIYNNEYGFIAKWGWE
jgi:hypothetical protein